ncbi:sodium-translocating pyrophosphatase [candidate division WOR-3 bacterium]|uniref:Putative K(+)-stimulated pyrophosphate-energized sodium pump n=1 Tax=candidate division WOR-3 bacterium TaxID=2052148 RepID=A0A937XGT3_UNCW3|nr:sodium-translocating pyrophosphatase [candidate division WOR-3 bacterium]
MNVSPIFWIAPGGAVIALITALILALQNMKRSEGTEPMKEVAKAVRIGAMAYLKQQYKGVTLFFGIVFVLLCVLAALGLQTWFVPFAFLTGGFFSGLSGFIGMSVGVRSSARTTWAAKQSLNSGLRVAFSAGMVMGLTVVGLGLIDLSIWYVILNAVFAHQPTAERLTSITSAMLAFGIGASSQALFARVGGGIFTKAADVGADLVGKVEAGIPEDDPRNPAVIADNVGDNVGDIAGMGADLYESYVGSMVATMALSIVAFAGTGFEVNGVLLPMVLAGVGILASIVGSFLVRAGEKAEQKVLLAALRRGVYGATVISAVLGFLIVRWLLPNNIQVFWSILSGLLAGVVVGYFTERFTSDTYKPVQGIAAEAKTSPATVIIEGLAVGMNSTIPIVITVAAAIMASYYLAGNGDPGLGLYGIGISAVGMLATLGITLATDAYGPVADNAGGNAEMTHQEPAVRERTDALDSLGNTTAATGKGFAIASAALTALALVAAYRDETRIISQKILGFTKDIDLSLMNPRLIAGVFLGAMLPMGVSSMVMRAVGRAASKIVEEVRRQFREIPGLMEGKAKPDYAHAVAICTKAAQKEMIAPSLMAIVTPILVGLLLGTEGVAGFLVGGLAAGFCLAIFSANSGGAWDNAKKYVERGAFGGKGSPAHKAAVVGDTVGDPLKDASGPSLNILLKLQSMVSIVVLGLVLKVSSYLPWLK